MSRIEDIKARLGKATPGPWEWQHRSTYGVVLRKQGIDRFVLVADKDSLSPANADLIAHAPQDLRDLLEVAEAAKALRDTAPGASTSYPDGRGGPIVRSNEYSRLRAALSRLDGEPTDA